MALTPVLKPSGFRPLGTGQLTYTFQEASIAGKPNYHVNILINGITGPTLTYYPDSTLLVTVDVAVFFRYALSMSPTVADRFMSGYVNYQAIWTGGSDAAVGLSGDVIYGYTGSNNTITNRATFSLGTGGGVFLTGVDALKVWANRTAYLDFLCDATLSAKSGLYFTGDSGNVKAVNLFSGTTKKMVSSSFQLTENGVFQVRQIAWTGKTEFEANTWKSVATSDISIGISPALRFFAVSSDGTHRVMYSDDGTTWFGETASAANPWNDIACGANGCVVAVSPTGTDRVMWRSAGTWIPFSASEANAWQSITYGNGDLVKAANNGFGRFVAVSNNGTHRCMTSDNGTLWANQTIQSEAWTKVRYCGTLFIAISSTSAKLSTSPDGATWTARTVTKAFTGVAYGNGMYVAVGSGASPEGATSTDGVTWTALDLPLASAAWVDICFGEGVFTLMTADSIVYQTIDTINYVITNPTPSTGVSWNALTYGNGMFIAVGASGGFAFGVMQGLSTGIGPTLDVDFQSECANPLYLKWLNDYGGLATQLFDYNQILNNIPDTTGRYKKMIVFLQSVTDSQWAAIQELNRSGAEYGDNQKLGAYVVDFTDESNPINIFVEPNPASTLTKSRGNNAQLVLRYPIIDNIDISS